MILGKDTSSGNEKQEQQLQLRDISDSNGSNNHSVSRVEDSIQTLED